MVQCSVLSLACRRLMPLGWLFMCTFLKRWSAATLRKFPPIDGDSDQQDEEVILWVCWRIWSRLSWTFLNISKSGLCDVVVLFFKVSFLPSWNRTLAVTGVPDSTHYAQSIHTFISLFLGTGKVFCCLQHLLSCYLAWVFVGFSHLSLCFLLRNISSSSCSFNVTCSVLTFMQRPPSCGSLCTFTLIACFSLHTCLAGSSTFQCCTKGKHACCFSPRFLRSSIHTGCFYLE